MTILIWIIAYALPASVAVYLNSRKDSLKSQALIVHGFVMLSILLLSAVGTRLVWQIHTFDIFSFILISLLAFLLLRTVGLVYVLSSIIQEICLLLAGAVLVSVYGILCGAIPTALMFAFAHKIDKYNWHWKFALLFVWGFISIALYTLNHQPIINIALHIGIGALLINRKFLLTHQY